MTLPRILALIAVALALSACNRSPEARAAKALAKGREQFAKKDYGHAVLQFRSAAKLLPKSAEPLYQAGLVYLEVGDIQNAANYFMKATTLDPNFAPAQIKAAELMAVNADPEVVREAERRAQSAMKASTSTPDAIAALALAEIRLGKEKSAEDHLRDALKRFPADLKSAVLMSLLKLQQQDPAGAEAVLKNAVAQAPSKADPIIALGRFYLVRGNQEQARASFTRALEIDPKNGMALADLGNILFSLNRKPEAEAIYKRMSALPDKQFNSAWALFLFHEGKKDDAITELVRLNKADPKDREARTRLVAAYLSTNHSDLAEKVLGDALKANNKDIDALLQRSEIYVLNGKFQLATQDLARVIGFRPDSAQAHYLSARVLQRQGSQLNQRRELTEALRYDPSLLIARVDLAQSYIEASDAKAALDLLRAAPKAQLDEPLLIVQTNWALIANGNLADAEKGIANGLSRSRTPDLLIQSAVLRLQAHKFPEARTLLEDALKIAPGDVRAVDLIARSYLAENKRDLATEKVRQYASNQPKSAALQQFLGSWLASTGDHAKAREAFAAAKSADPTSSAADIATAQLDLVERKYDDARNRLAKMVQSNSQNLDAQLLLGMVNEASGRFDDAIKGYQTVVAAEPGNPIALNNLSYRLSEANRSDEALKYAQQAVELNPSNAAFKDTLGWAYVKKGLYSSAISHLVAAANPRVPVRMYHLAYAYAKSGDNKKASETYQAAQKIAPTLPEAKLVADLLK